MKTKIYFKLYSAITFISLGIITIDCKNIIPWIFFAIGIIFAIFLRKGYKNIGEKDFDKLFDVIDE